MPANNNEKDVHQGIPYTVPANQRCRCGGVKDKARHFVCASCWIKLPGSLRDGMSTKQMKESAQLEATLVLLRRGELPLAVRVLNPERDTELAIDLQAYIAAHSRSDSGSTGALSEGWDK
jgi:hypothetical protein